MSANTPTSDAVPGGLLKQLLAEFGMEWTSILLLSALLISTFGLDKTLDSGILAVATTAGLSVVYLFRDGISRWNLNWCGAATLVLWTATTITAVMVADQANTSLNAVLTEHRRIGSLAVGLLVSLPVAALIITYKTTQATQARVLLPLLPEISKTADDAVLDSVFVHRQVSYVLEFSEAQDRDHIWVGFEVTLTPLNRSTTKQVYSDIFDPPGTNVTFDMVNINGHFLDPADPDYRTKRGLVISREIEPGQSQTWTVECKSLCRSRDSDLYGAYLAAAALTVLVKRPPNWLQIAFISHLQRKVDPITLPNGDMEFTSGQGVLPFQGCRLIWEPK